MNWFISLFTSYKILVSFHLKSGEVIKIPCDDFKLQHRGNELVGYDIIGAKVGAATYIRLDDVSAVTYVAR